MDFEILNLIKENSCSGESCSFKQIPQLKGQNEVIAIDSSALNIMKDKDASGFLVGI